MTGPSPRMLRQSSQSSQLRQSAALAGLMSMTTASAICSRIPLISTRASTTSNGSSRVTSLQSRADRLFYFYRLNPLGRERQPGLGAHDASRPPRAQEPLSPQIHISVFLTAPAVLVVTLA